MSASSSSPKDALTLFDSKEKNRAEEILSKIPESYISDLGKNITPSHPNKRLSEIIERLIEVRRLLSQSLTDYKALEQEISREEPLERNKKYEDIHSLLTSFHLNFYLSEAENLFLEANSHLARYELEKKKTVLEVEKAELAELKRKKLEDEEKKREKEGKLGKEDEEEDELDTSVGPGGATSSGKSARSHKEFFARLEKMRDKEQKDMELLRTWNKQVHNQYIIQNGLQAYYKILIYLPTDDIRFLSSEHPHTLDKLLKFATEETTPLSDKLKWSKIIIRMGCRFNKEEGYRNTYIYREKMKPCIDLLIEQTQRTVLSPTAFKLSPLAEETLLHALSLLPLRDSIAITKKEEDILESLKPLLDELAARNPPLVSRFLKDFSEEEQEFFLHLLSPKNKNRVGVEEGLIKDDFLVIPDLPKDIKSIIKLTLGDDIFDRSQGHREDYLLSYIAKIAQLIIDHCNHFELKSFESNRLNIIKLANLLKTNPSQDTFQILMAEINNPKLPKTGFSGFFTGHKLAGEFKEGLDKIMKESNVEEAVFYLTSIRESWAPKL